MVEPLYSSGRGVATDNFFTSVPLAEELLSNRLPLIGTVRKNKPDTPDVLKSLPK